MTITLEKLFVKYWKVDLQHCSWSSISAVEITFSQICNKKKPKTNLNIHYSHQTFIFLKWHQRCQFWTKCSHKDWRGRVLKMEAFHVYFIVDSAVFLLSGVQPQWMQNKSHIWDQTDYKKKKAPQDHMFLHWKGFFSSNLTALIAVVQCSTSRANTDKAQVWLKEAGSVQNLNAGTGCGQAFWKAAGRVRWPLCTQCVLTWGRIKALLPPQQNTPTD